MPKRGTAADRRAVVERNLWAAPVFFVAVAWALFKAGEGTAASRAAWTAYAAGWVPALGMLGWSAARRRRPGTGAVIGFGVLLVMGALFRLNHG